jgi:hypothetical protein
MTSRYELGRQAAQCVDDNTSADQRALGEQVSVMWKQIERLTSRMNDLTGGP